MSALGFGRDVRYGFCDMAASIVSSDSGGVTMVMSMTVSTAHERAHITLPMTPIR